jgi:5-formyltetrahydrofolate cyclo-ligase
LPRVSDLLPETPLLYFHVIEAGDALMPGRFGIPEPDGFSLVTIMLPAIDIVIVPGVAFDAEGGRVGFGGGYYDCTLAWNRNARRPTLIGLAYDFQIVDRCPTDELDVPVDMVVTDARVLQRGMGGLGERR